MFRGKVISVLLLICCVSILIGMLCYEPNHKSSSRGFSKVSNDELVSSYSECVVSVLMKDIVVDVVPWKSTNGMYYLAVPSATEAFFFKNLSNDCIIYSEGRSIDVSAAIDFESIGECEMILDSSELLIIYKSENISSMFVSIESSISDLDAKKNVEHVGTCKIFSSDGDETYADERITISPRGNSTFLQDKKPYEFELSEAGRLVEDVYAKKWVLLANAFDSSLMKNAIVYDFVNQYTELPTTKGEFVDLYINGDYRGNYYLCMNPQINGQSVDVVDLEKNNKTVNGSLEFSQDELKYSSDYTAYGYSNKINYPDSTGGYIVEFVEEGQIDGGKCYFVTDSGAIGKVKFPQNATIEQVEYIKNLFNELEKAADSEGGINPDTGKSITDYLDIDSYVNRYLVDSLFQNIDSKVGSSFFYKDSDSIDGKLYAGPLWDYDLTMKFTDIYSIKDISVIGNIYMFDSLIKNEMVKECLESYARDVYESYVLYDLPHSVNNIEKRIEKSRFINDLRWNIDTGTGLYADRLIQTTQERFASIKEQIFGDVQYCTVEFRDYYGKNIFVDAVKCGQCIDDIPIVSSYVAIFSGWRSSSNGTYLNSETKIWEDTVYESQWIPIETILDNGLAISNMEIENIDVTELEKIVDEIKKRQKSRE